MRATVAVIGLTLLSTAALASDAKEAPAAGPPGQATYMKLCKSCHAENGRGAAAKATALKLDPNLLDLARPEAAKLTPEERREIVAKGKGKMPAYGEKLGAAEVDAVLTYTTELLKTSQAK